MWPILFLCVGLMSCVAQSALLDQSKVAPVGVFFTDPYKLKITGPETTKLMVIRLIPSLGAAQTCTQPSIDEYKLLMTSVITPIQAVLARTMAAVDVTEQNTTSRIAGVIVGSVALGVATSAQITAGIALHNSQENAKAIAAMGNAITATNTAVQNLITAQGQTVTVINTMQDQVNNDIIPAINTLACSISQNRMSIILGQFFSFVQVAFGPVIQSPINSPITVQALNTLFGGDLSRFMEALGYSPGDLSDVLATGSATVRVIAVDPVLFTLTLEASFPTIIDYPGSSIIPIQAITFSTNGSEWLTQTPPWIHTKETQVSGFDPSMCKLTDTSMVCPRDTTYSLSDSVLTCLSGVTSTCPKIRVLNGLSPRYVVYKGVVIANCRATSCVCTDTGRPIAPLSGTLLTEINQEMCSVIGVDGVLIRAEQKLEGVSWGVSIAALGPTIQLDPVDISSEMGAINHSINAAQKALDESKRILQHINPDIVNTESAIATIVLAVLSLVMIFFGAVALIYLHKKINNLAQAQRIASFQMSPTLAHRNYAPRHRG
ncbi:fusion protein [Wenling triplecross lizardfish paramyxovirus]|uniref:Fusion glycoprotein F0 n=1 Tax=Wenling triplecross lizardfish paramyxovirus TaxID=2116451 RepID=A0A2P1GMZ1_9MONO|nr:fusion protein [Wenling triplecross lizardfish paramyxovirus]AVM87367.1 fusion protein [Wenling triplecross lizardfish paramyxovirus]AVM87389.1 fusion protein [Wenling triplecross lizardfish paramyxovirus]